jgi:hypothetical protein
MKRRSTIPQMVAKLDFILYQCCGTGIGTTGTVTYCLSGTGTGMKNGSGFGTVFKLDPT